MKRRFSSTEFRRTCQSRRQGRGEGADHQLDVSADVVGLGHIKLVTFGDPLDLPPSYGASCAVRPRMSDSEEW